MVLKASFQQNHIMYVNPGGDPPLSHKPMVTYSKHL